ncbi:hypothetical protein F7725_020625, partial [Dissostichus mawsoni]
MVTVIGLYGETLEIPCNNGAVNAEDVLITKWKYDKGEGLSGDLLVKRKDQNVSILTTDEYKGRVSMAAKSSLLLSAPKLSDQRTFTCMVVAGVDITEYPVNVVIQKTPEGLEISDKAEELEIGKLTKASVLVNDVTGLSTTSSVLEYSAQKEDTDAVFTCSTKNTLAARIVSSPVTFSITYSTENLILQVTGQDSLVEGDSMTLKCVADGNPAPTAFNFHLKVQVLINISLRLISRHCMSLKGKTVKVENADSYTITNVSRNTTGEYKCSLVDDPTMEASKAITVNYLDINLIPSGNIVKSAGEALHPNLKIDSSGDTKVSWTKDNVKLDKEPKFAKLTFADSGRYECEVTLGLLNQKASLELTVEGAPVITELTKKRGEDGTHEELICKAEGSPKPAVSWSINGTLIDESPFVNGKITQKIRVVPTENLTVSCMVSNELGVATKTINVSSINFISYLISVIEEVRMDKKAETDENDQTKLVVGVVVALIVATLVLGLAYLVYVKKF